MVQVNQHLGEIKSHSGSCHCILDINLVESVKQFLKMFFVNRDSDVDVRTISVSYGRQGGSPGSDYTVSLARYLDNGEIAHIPDSLENEHRFFLKLLDGACGDWGKRIARIAADCVKIASRQ